MPMIQTLFNISHLRYSRIWLAIGIVFLGVTVVLSVVNIPGAVEALLLQDKVSHFIAYAGLMGWFSQIFRHPVIRLLLAIFFISLGIGVEFLQAMVPSRQFELLDMLANTSGVLVAWALAYTWFGTILEWFERTCLTRQQPA